MRFLFVEVLFWVFFKIWVVLYWWVIYVDVLIFYLIFCFGLWKLCCSDVLWVIWFLCCWGMWLLLMVWGEVFKDGVMLLIWCLFLCCIFLLMLLVWDFIILLLLIFWDCIIWLWICCLMGGFLLLGVICISFIYF